MADAGGMDNRTTDTNEDWTKSGTSEERLRPDVRGGHYGTPSGVKPGVDEEKYNEIVKKARPTPTQDVAAEERALRKFHHTQFIGHVSDDMRFDKFGNMRVTFIVPYEFKHLAMPLSDGFGIPMHVDVQVWKPYDEAAKGVTNTEGEVA